MSDAELKQAIKELREGHNTCSLRVQGHMARHEALWDGIREWRRRVEAQEEACAKKLNELEKKVAYYAGAAAAVGALAGRLIPELFKLLNGN